MVKAIVIYGSTTGTTENIAQIVAQKMKSSEKDVAVKNAASLDSEELIDYDLILLGCSTWGDGELQHDFIGFEEKLRGVDLNGKKAAVFGPGESSYPQFCKAVDILEEALKKCGAELISLGLKIDVLEGDYNERVRIWVKELLLKFKAA